MFKLKLPVAHLHTAIPALGHSVHNNNFWPEGLTFHQQPHSITLSLPASQVNINQQDKPNNDNFQKLYYNVVVGPACPAIYTLHHPIQLQNAYLQHQVIAPSSQQTSGNSYKNYLTQDNRNNDYLPFILLNL